MRLASLERRQLAAAVPAVAPAGNPCPTSNGTSIGTLQPFTIFCDADVVGNVVNTTATTSFAACADACASNHPRCEGVTFDGRQCQMKANLRQARPIPSRRVDTAIGQFPTATSNCNTLGANSLSGSATFNLFCNAAANGNDIGQTFAQTFEACMGVCSGTNGCGAISFDASLALGFQNCYLKGPTPANALRQRVGIDTAVFNSSVAAAAPVQPSSSIAAESVTAVAPPPPSTETPEPVTTDIAPTDTAFPLSSFVSSLSDPVETGIVFTTDSIATGLGSIPTPGASFGTGPGGDFSAMGGVGAAPAAPPNTDLGAINAAVAAPTVGAVAGAFVIGTGFVLWARKRAAAAASRGEDSVFAKIRFLRPSGRGGARTDRTADEVGVLEMPKSGGGVGNYGGSSRGSTGSTPRYEVRGGKMAESWDSSGPGMQMAGGNGRGNGSGLGMAMIAAQARDSGPDFRRDTGSSIDGIPSFLRQ